MVNFIAEDLITELLRLVGDKYDDGRWYGHDIILGTNEEIMRRGKDILEKYGLMTNICSLRDTSQEGTTLIAISPRVVEEHRQ